MASKYSFDTNNFLSYSANQPNNQQTNHHYQKHTFMAEVKKGTEENYSFPQ